MLQDGKWSFREQETVAAVMFGTLCYIFSVLIFLAAYSFIRQSAASHDLALAAASSPSANLLISPAAVRSVPVPSASCSDSI